MKNQVYLPPLITHKLLAYILILSGIIGCAGKDSETAVKFCEMGYDPSNSEKFSIDLSALMAYGLDKRGNVHGSGNLRVFNVDSEYLGFTWPFPFMVPTPERLKKNLPAEWEHGGYIFNAFYVDPANTDWIMINANLDSDAENKIQTSLVYVSTLYSIKNGVLTIHMRDEYSDEILDGEKLFTSNFYPCSNTSLTYQRMAEAAKNFQLKSEDQ